MSLSYSISKYCNLVENELVQYNLYRSLGLSNKRQIDDFFFFFTRK